MPRTRRFTSPLDLKKYDVLIEDRSARSDYFKLSQFDGYLYGGRNAFLLAGSGILKPRSKVLVEILNKDGSTVYSTPISSLSEGGSRLIQAEVYEDTPIGPGKIVILGCATRYADGTPIPLEWRDKYNVRWVSDVIISPRIENRTQIRFENPPSMTVEEKFYFAPSSSTFVPTNTENVTIELTPKFFSVYPNGYLAKIRSSPGVEFDTDFDSLKLSGSIKFLGTNGPETASIDLSITETFSTTLAEIDGQTIVTDRGTIINGGIVSSSGEFITRIDPIGSIPITSSLALVYNRLISQDTGSVNSYADIRLVDLSTHSGEINKIRVSYKSATNPGAFVTVAEVPTTVNELLSIDTGSKVAETGDFSEVIVGDYWYAHTMSYQKTDIVPNLPPAYFTSSATTAPLNIDLVGSPLSDGILANVPISSGGYDGGVTYFIGSTDQNTIRLFPRSEYTLEFDAVVAKRSGSVELTQDEYGLDIYLVPTSASRLYAESRLGQKIGSLTPTSGFRQQSFRGTQLNFIPEIIAEGDYGIRLIGYGGFWNFANISVKPATEPFFSPDEVNFLIPNIGGVDDILQYKAEYLDINNNSIGIETLSLPTYFSGSIETTLDNYAQWNIGVESTAGSGSILSNALLSLSGSGGVTITRLGTTITIDGTGVGGGGLITSYINPANNRVVTSVDGNTINAESNLTFNGTALSLTGSAIVSDSIRVGTNPALEGTLRIPNGVLNGLYGRNAANTNSHPLVYLDGSNVVQLGESGIPVSIADDLTVGAGITVGGLSTQGSEATALVINGSNVVGTRELGSLAFSSATYDNYSSWTLQKNGVAGTTVGSGGVVNFVDGTNTTVTAGANGTVQINATDANTGTVTSINLSGGTDITVSGGPVTTSGTITVNHADTSTLSGNYGGAANGVVIEDITVDGRGHVTSIGTIDLDSRFDNYGQWNIAANGTVGTSAITSGNTVTFSGAGATTVTRSGDNITISSTDTNTTYSAGAGLDLSGTTFLVEADIREYLNTTYGNNSGEYAYYDGTNQRISWYTAAAEDMRLDASGNLHVDANITAYSTTISDRRQKKNIKDLKYGLNEVKKLRAVEFNWKLNKRGHDIGFIAQEVQDVIPDVVRETSYFDEEGVLSVSYEKVVPVLVNAIKEQQEQIDELKEMVNKLLEDK